MTLVVTEVSKHGIVMVGDSAVTMRNRSSGKLSVKANAVKVLYSEAANIGFTLWGAASVGNYRLDYWMDDFVDSEVHNGDTVVSVGEKLNTALNLRDTEWEQNVKGIHVAGFMDGVPVLYHVHCDRENEPPHELRLYRDYPDDLGLSLSQFRVALEEQDGIAHLRNGYHTHFAVLYDAIERFAGGLGKVFGSEFPHPSLHGRLKYYELLVKTVAGALEASHEHQGVNSELSSIAFTSSGLVYDQRRSFAERDVVDFASFDIRM